MLEAVVYYSTVLSLYQQQLQKFNSIYSIFEHVLPFCKVKIIKAIKHLKIQLEKGYLQNLDSGPWTDAVHISKKIPSKISHHTVKYVANMIV